jgi:Protein of unknown function (DUF2585)
MALAAGVELINGRRIWGVKGEPGFWSGDINSEHNSQFFADPYSFSHITHGVLLYGLAWLIAAKMPVRTRALIVLAIECLWEVIENTNAVIERYRAATISLHYYGDSIVNSMSDILFCMLGFALAAMLPVRASLLLVLMLEVGLALWIRDDFALNVIMLVHPVAAIRAWQSAL